MNIAESAKEGIPIARSRVQPGLGGQSFLLRCCWSWVYFLNGEKVISYVPENRGVACVEVNEYQRGSGMVGGN
jgi:hypothetical protein